jgi:hypothetical protein
MGNNASDDKKRPKEADQAAEALQQHLNELKEKELLDLAAERLRNDTRDRVIGLDRSEEPPSPKRRWRDRKN